MDLTEFLLARVTEDEAVARKAGGEAWECAEYLGSLRVQTVATHGRAGYEERIGVTHDTEGLSDSVDSEDGAHIARHDPARVLAECEAKRAIVEYHSAFHVTTWNDGLDWDYRGCSECSEPEEWKPSMGDWFPCRTLRALAAVYADHTDFRDWWRP